MPFKHLWSKTVPQKNRWNKVSFSMRPTVEGQHIKILVLKFNPHDSSSVIQPISILTPISAR